MRTRSFERRIPRLVLWGVSVLPVLTACDAGSKSRSAGASIESVPSSAAQSKKPVFAPRPRDGRPIDAFVRSELARGQAEHTRVLVYVGATWCEPCRRFHEAVERGELDAQLSSLRFLEFDRDQDGPELDQAGYGSRLIPLLAVPEANGRGGGMRIEGSIKGPTAVQQNLLPRLLGLLAERPGSP